ncbi:MAG: ABC transporter permease, partial [Paramuribaculum sp.]|nr:ABC transporter permease [Paramuribaculum sp.]
LWIVLAVIILIFSIAAIIPANLFSKVPVSQVFRRYTEKKHGWKYALLLVEFAGTALVVGMLVVVMTQYKVLMNTDYGYSDDNLVIVVNDGQESQEHTDANMAALKSLPYIEGITRSIAAPSWGYSGEFIRNSAGKELFSSRFDYVCSNYPEVMGMEFVAGKMAPSDSTSVIVNELFAEKIGFTPENAIGQTIKCGSDNVVITGVLKNFKIGSYYNEMMPYIAFNYDRMRHSLFNVQVAEPFERNFELLSDTLPKMMNSGNDLYFQSVREIKSEYYKNVKEFQILVSIAAIVLLIICVIGMMGYLSDEMSRRSREIAVRKVNGASTASVVKLICKSILITSIPAVAVGIIAAWYISRMWLEQFTVTLDHIAIRFIVSGICTVIIILGIAGGLTIRKASANPVENLRSE